MKLVAFDLDDTLAPSKSPLPPLMDQRLQSLLDHVPVCIISGGQIGQFRAQVLSQLHASDRQLFRLHLMPTCGTRYYRYEDGQWAMKYAHDLDPQVRDRAIASLERRAKELGLWEEDTWGPIIEDRGSQITYSALGQEAPLDAKRAWDPDGAKKALLRDAVAPDVPELDVRGGGSTSIDITTRGIDKAYGMGKLVEATGIAPHWTPRATTTPSRPPGTRRAPSRTGTSAPRRSPRSWGSSTPGRPGCPSPPRRRRGLHVQARG